MLNYVKRGHSCLQYLAHAFREPRRGLGPPASESSNVYVAVEDYGRGFVPLDLYLSIAYIRVRCRRILSFFKYSIYGASNFNHIEWCLPRLFTRYVYIFILYVLVATFFSFGKASGQTKINFIGSESSRVNPCLGAEEGY